MRDYFVIYVNGRQVRVDGVDAFLSLAEFLRSKLRLTGCKVVCNEGDCGACTVLVGKPVADGRLEYRPVDACIVFVYQLDCRHVVTIEGVSPTGMRSHDPHSRADETVALGALQRGFVEEHASQCGFCTPGFVMAALGTGEITPSIGRCDVSTEGCVDAAQAPAGKSPPAEHRNAAEWAEAVSGNLCRCTGYLQILSALTTWWNRVDSRPDDSLATRYPSAAMCQDFAALEPTSEVCTPEGEGSRRVVVPRRLDEALRLLHDRQGAQLVAGATDVGVRANKAGVRPSEIVCLSHIDEMRYVNVDGEVLRIGAGTTWTETERAVREYFPEFATLLHRFGSPQIRNLGTVGGNVANGSPIADSLPFFFAMESTVQVASVGGERTVAISELYRGYKDLALEPGEMIVELRTPLPGPRDRLQLFKISRRKDLDIASFTAAVRLRCDGDRIERAWIACGAAGPTVRRAPAAESALSGKAWTHEAFEAAAIAIQDDVAPISDVRGSEAYRRRLAGNVLRKCFYTLDPSRDDPKE
ncbi:MAG: FAD binding domain-containing protein [Planctomycetales bacterium]|nr:FAD binding domain-containing protein [Planctomycetales bacterium]